MSAWRLPARLTRPFVPLVPDSRHVHDEAAHLRTAPATAAKQATSSAGPPPRGSILPCTSPAHVARYCTATAITWDDLCVTVVANPDRGEPTEIMFSNGNRAVLVKDRGADPSKLLAALGLQSGASGSGAIPVCGGADELTGASLTRAEEVLGPAVSAAAQVTGAAVFDGGTASGVMAITGAARGRRPWTMPVLVGVAPAGLVSSHAGSQLGGDRVSLQENHSHFVLAESSEWGAETGLLIGLSAAYAADRRVVVVLAGGGRVESGGRGVGAPRLAGLRHPGNRRHG